MTMVFVSQMLRFQHYIFFIFLLIFVFLDFCIFQPFWFIYFRILHFSFFVFSLLSFLLRLRVYSLPIYHISLIPIHNNCSSHHRMATLFAICHLSFYHLQSSIGHNCRLVPSHDLKSSNKSVYCFLKKNKYSIK